MQIVGIAGAARSGKDTLSGFLEDFHDFKRVALADPLRQFISVLTGIPFDELLDSQAKETPLPAFGGKTPRELMQSLGTEWARNHVAKDAWLTVATREVNKARAEGYAGVVVPDIRYDNEAEWIRSMGGMVVHLSRADRPAVSGSDHASEQGISEALIDLRFTNDGPVHRLCRLAGLLAHA
ncbi:MAG: adenylate kinase [Pseudomonadota bacterium]|nr:adenylate kinase [Pseudomonadota bacterium]